MESNLNSEPIKKEIKLNSQEARYATGRRKKSIARVWLKKGSGNINVNGKKNRKTVTYKTNQSHKLKRTGRINNGGQ